jgi:hypothetical protein
MPLKRALVLYSGKIRATLACRIGLLRRASEMWCGSHLLPRAPRVVSDPPMLGLARSMGLCHQESGSTRQVIPVSVKHSSRRGTKVFVRRVSFHGCGPGLKKLNLGLFLGVHCLPSLPGSLEPRLYVGVEFTSCTGQESLLSCWPQLGENLALLG